MSMEEWHVKEPYLAIHCSLGEGPHYIPERNELRFMDINNHKLFIIDLDKGPESVRSIETSMPIGVTADIEGVDSSEVILVGAKDGVTKFNLRTGKHDYVAKYWSGEGAEEKNRKMRSNDGSVDTAGRFWVQAFVDPEIAEVTDEGVMFRLESNNKLRTMIDKVEIPNGMSWNEKDDTMFFTDSPVQDIYAYDFDRSTGDIKNRRVFYHHDEEGIVPDGHAMDKDGNIWQAFHGGSKVLRIHPDGKVTGIVHLPTRNITCPVFAGTKLFITSATEGDPENHPQSAKYGGNLFCVDVGITGMPKHKVKMS